MPSLQMPIEIGVSNVKTIRAIEIAATATLIGFFVAIEAMHTTISTTASKSATFPVKAQRMGTADPFASSRVAWQGLAQKATAPTTAKAHKMDIPFTITPMFFFIRKSPSE